MRPYKHVATTRFSGSPRRFQNVVGIDLGRLSAPWGEVPIAVTAERDAITLFVWSPAAERWLERRIEHLPLDAPGTDPSAPSQWNASERVGVVCLGSTVHLFYKRAVDVNGEAITALFHTRFRIRNLDPAATNQALDFVDTQELERVQPGKHEVGRSLWAGERGGVLLVASQQRTSPPLGPIGPWQLMLRRLVLDANTGDFDDQGAKPLEAGGFDFDARLDGGVLHVVHRAVPEAFRIPLLMTSGGTSLTSGPAADAHWLPLRWIRYDLASDTTTGEALPGGEHPILQSTQPLAITFERPSTLTITLSTPVIPLPPAQPGIAWAPGPPDTVLVYREGSETYRGTLLTGTAHTFPRSLAEWHESALLFDLTGGLCAYRSAFRTNPSRFLEMNRGDKALTVEVLHHREFLGLYRTRFQTALTDAEVVVTERAFEVWDIGHRQIGDWDTIAPNGEPENRQFAPVVPIRLTTAPRVGVDGVQVDNTIGGHLVTEPSHPRPTTFFGYTDLGDGGLRVIYAPDIAPLSDPPPIEDEKTLRPDQVTGPPIACDVWVEVRAPDWRATEVPGYSVGIGETNRSLGSALEVPLDFLLDAASIVSGSGDTPDGQPIDPAAGVTRPELEAIDTFRAGLAPPHTEEVDFVEFEGGAETTVTGVITITPGGAIADLELVLELDVDGVAPDTTWTAIPRGDIPAGVSGPVSPFDLGGVGSDPFDPPVFLLETGNPATVTLPAEGRWRISAFTQLGADGTPGLAAFTDLNVADSTYNQLTLLYDGVTDGELHEIGDLEPRMLRYDMRYGVGQIGDRPVSIRLRPRLFRESEMRFSAREQGQGVVRGRQVLTFASEDMRLKGALSAFVEIQSFSVSIHYGRSFTPGMLMRDSRAWSPLDGRDLGDAPNESVGRSRASRHAAIGAKPVGNANIFDVDVGIDLSLTWVTITLAAIVTLLLLIGAVALIATVIGIFAGLAVALAAGAIGAVAAVVLTIALTVIVALVIPGLVAEYAEGEVRDTLMSDDMLERLNDLPILRYSGEGTAEGVARAALLEARDQGLVVPFPANEDDDDAGLDRSYGQLFQMVFASDGVCRVLLRVEDCDPADPPDLPDLPGGGDDDPGIDIGAGVGGG